MAKIKTAAYVKAGALVCARRQAGTPGRRPVGTFRGRLLENARIGPQAGWDVYDVQTHRGVRSAYGFDLNRCETRRKRRR